MSVDNKLSNLIESQFPDFVREDGPNFVSFVKAYYEWAESANNSIYVTNKLTDYTDIDKTDDKYFEYFHREIMGSIPRDIVTDKKQLAKKIRELYRARGSEQSYRLLFRLLYNEEIEFYYPGEDILRASDGRWVKDNSIRVGKPRNGAISLFENESLVGLSSGATAKVERIVNTISGGEILDELYIIDIDGDFQDNEKVALVSNNTIFATIVNVSGPLQAVNIVKGGAYHRADDPVAITSTSGSGANGVVISTSDTSAAEWYIDNGGHGYTTGSTITITGGSGFEAEFRIDAIANTEVIPINTDLIFPFANVVIGTGPTFVSLGANTAAVSANLASANSGSVIATALSFTNLTVGTISQITTTDYGYGYATLPTATVIQENVANLLLPAPGGGIKGLNARILARNAPGAITAVRVNAFGQDYGRYDPVTITNSRSGTQAAIGDPFVSGVVNYPGRYIDTKGWLSWNNKLQDNFYYQEFSYEIKSDQFRNTYRNIINTLLHPAGTKGFGRLRIYSDDIAPPQVTVDVSTATKVEIENQIVIDLPNIISEYYSVESLPEIIGESILVTTTPSVSSAVVLYNPGIGTLFVSDNTVIGSYSSNVISNFATIPISYIGTPKLIIGNNTIFTTELTPNTAIIVSDPFGGTPDGLYFTEIVSSNNVIAITVPYANTTLANGTFYYASNTSP